MPTIVCVLKPRTRAIRTALQQVGAELDLAGWNPITLTSIMRTAKSLCSLGYNLEKSDTAVNSVIGMDPVVICINTWDIGDLEIGLAKAMELAAKRKEKQILLIVDDPQLFR